VQQGGESSQQWKNWLEKYAARIESEKEEWVSASEENLEGDWQAQREKEARLANPRFVLRQWVLEEVIAKVEADAQNGRHVLAKVMQVSTFDMRRSFDDQIHVRHRFLKRRWHVIPLSLGVEKEMKEEAMS